MSDDLTTMHLRGREAYHDCCRSVNFRCLVDVPADISIKAFLPVEGYSEKERKAWQAGWDEAVKWAAKFDAQAKEEAEQHHLSVSEQKTFDRALRASVDVVSEDKWVDMDLEGWGDDW